MPHTLPVHACACRTPPFCFALARHTPAICCWGGRQANLVHTRELLGCCWWLSECGQLPVFGVGFALAPPPQPAVASGGAKGEGAVRARCFRQVYNHVLQHIELGAWKADRSTQISSLLPPCEWPSLWPQGHAQNKIKAVCEFSLRVAFYTSVGV